MARITVKSRTTEVFSAILTPIPNFDARDFAFNKQAKAQNTKNETDAVVPHLSNSGGSKLPLESDEKITRSLSDSL